VSEEPQLTYKELMAQSEAKHHAKLMKGRGPLAWAMRFLRDNPLGAGEIYELNNILTFVKRIPAIVTVGLLYGAHYDIHTAQSGVAGTPEGKRMRRVYAHAKKYPNEVEHTYSFIQILTLALPPLPTVPTTLVTRSVPGPPSTLPGRPVILPLPRLLSRSGSSLSWLCAFPSV
jgi:hypothetical protein